MYIRFCSQWLLESWWKRRELSHRETLIEVMPHAGRIKNWILRICSSYNLDQICNGKNPTRWWVLLSLHCHYLNRHICWWLDNAYRILRGGNAVNTSRIWFNMGWSGIIMAIYISDRSSQINWFFPTNAPWINATNWQALDNIQGVIL